MFPRVNRFVKAAERFADSISQWIKALSGDKFRIIPIVVLALTCSLLVGIFIASNKAAAQTVTNCTNIGVLKNGRFEAPVAGLPINNSGGTYPGFPAQNATPPQYGGIYRELSNGYYFPVDATMDTSTYRTYVFPGQTNDERAYWYTTESDNSLELNGGGSSYGGVTPADGSQMIELNANVNAAIFQDLATVPGEVMRWSLKHASRNGSAESMKVEIGNPTNSVAAVMASAPEDGDGASNSGTSETNHSVTRTNSARAGLVTQQATLVGTNTPTTSISDSSHSWSTWYGAYTDTNTTNSTTRLMFEAISPTTGSGNELDSIIFSPVAACPITRELNSTLNTATINPFDTSTSSYAIVPNEVGSSESITSLTKVSGPGTATLNSGNMTFQYAPGGSGTSVYNYTIAYSANSLTSTSSGTIKITARDPYGAASCSPGSVQETSSVTNSQTTVIESFVTPTQANTDNASDHQSATCTWTVPDNVYAVDYLVVAGGGGGASGGGGGGGVVTSWSTYLASTNGSRNAAGNPLAVTPGNVINVTVGGGGARGWGGSVNCASAGCAPTRVAANGADSKFGSIVAKGGGAGGTAGGAGSPGGSGGGAAYDFTGTNSNSNASAVIGAATYGNIGGGATGSGGYRAGSGGGGAGTAVAVSDPPSGGDGGIGGQNRSTSGLSSTISGGNSAGAGGHGGRGVSTNIASFSGSTYSEYGCGGGGGLNDNSNMNQPNLQGKAGCSTAGNGSSYATYYNDVGTQFNGTEVPTESFGGGGGGTDPEGSNAGSGGSGVVVIRYIVPNVNCPNSTNNTAVAGPIACPYPITITAGAAVQIAYNLTYGDASNGYFSYPGANTDTATVNTTIGNGTDTITSTPVSGGLTFTFQVSNPNSLLVGATYPLQYTIYSGGQTSTSYVLLKVTDPNQHTPLRVPVDPRATFVRLPIIRLGNPDDTQVCFTPESDSVHNGYSNVPTATRTDNNSNETTVASSVAGQLILQGRTSALQAGMAYIQINKNAADRYLLPDVYSRFIDVNVSNTSVGGNGSCTFGTATVLELYPIGLSVTKGRDLRLNP